MDDLKLLMAREIPHLRRYARALVGDADRADDIVQDCLEKALRKRQQWRRQGSVRHWLFRILYRCHVDALRSRRREVDADEYEWATAPAQEKRIECHDVAEAMAALPASQREVLLLVALEGMSYDEAALVLGIEVGTVRSRLSRGRESLRRSWIGVTTRLRRVK
ncbi:RNA polymerase sigma factor [Telmatospirillum sp. J64-1]|uniref:RNA polymerase sigma factor n=1 Tax=Telmatospirillum sp. J64-1 TaxID=2502183 RepID=UPI00115C9DDF|nr:sigma-70 family RNA polymerase sigma factor [Telmatospirillum sp. J64-1]